VSMVVSLTLIPVLASRFLARRRMPSTGPVYDLLARGYEAVLRVLLRFPRTVVLVSLLAAVPGWLIFRNIETGFMPAMDEGAFVLDYEMPVGTSLVETDKVLRRVEQVLIDTPDIAGYIRRTGAELGFFATESFTGDILVSLKPPGSRRPIDEIFDDLRQRLEETTPELETEFVPLIQDQINDLRGVARPIEVKVFGPDRARLRELASRVAEIVENAGAEDVNAHVYLGNPDLIVRPDSVEAGRVGLTAADIESQLNAALYGQVATTLPEQDRITNIRVRYPDSVRFDRQALGELPISLSAVAAANPAATFTDTAAALQSQSPRYVPLRQVASLSVVSSPNELWRENQQPVITVTADLGARGLGTVNRELEQRLSAMTFPPGYRWELAGDYRAQQESFASLFTVLIVASTLVFLLLGFQFRSLALPVLIFLSQPVSLTSGLVALWITGTPLNVSSFMGAILLIGLDVKNGIILIEYIGQLRHQGLPLHEALVRAGRTRFRPILMTSLCTILGLLPLALGLGPGAQMQQPLAIAVIGGLTANMLVTRLLIPVGYLALQRREQATTC
jgi:multidrug efflux pump subunit AcrB